MSLTPGFRRTSSMPGLGSDARLQVESFSSFAGRSERVTIPGNWHKCFRYMFGEEISCEQEPSFLS